MCKILFEFYPSFSEIAIPFSVKTFREKGQKNRREIPAALSAGLVIRVSGIRAVTGGGGEFLGRKGDSGEHFTGILPAAGIVTAFLAGNGIIQYRYHQLGIPLQSDDGELSQGHQQLPLASGKYQRIFIKLPDAVRYLHGNGIAAAGICFLHFRGQNHGIQDLHCGHQIGR